MMKILPLLACSLLALAPPVAAKSQSGGQTPARARANLAELFSDADYPAAAVRNGEQGPVTFRLAVGPDGAPTGCDVTVSSGSPILDSTTCRLLMERARFEPARDSAGKPTSDSLTGRIVWRLPAGEEGEDDLSDLPPAPLLWMICVGGEAAKLAPGDLPPDEVVRRSFGPCTALEAMAARDPAFKQTSTDPRTEASRIIEPLLVQIRERLRAPPAPETP